MQKTNIDWVKNDDGSQGMSANPIRGKCLHNCPYCYAEEIRTHYNQPEDISWHPDVLDRIRKRRKPTTFFIGSTHDIMGKWISNTWIDAIFQTAIDCPQHRFIFLTKNARRAWFSELLQQPNIWFGGTVTSSKDRDNALQAGGFNNSRQSFISFEPVLGDIFQPVPGPNVPFVHKNTKWFIIGALTRRGRVVPASQGGTRLEWVLPIIELANRHGIPVFLKDNLLKLYPQLSKRQEIPWLVNTQA